MTFLHLTKFPPPKKTQFSFPFCTRTFFYSFYFSYFIVTQLTICARLTRTHTRVLLHIRINIQETFPVLIGVLYVFFLLILLLIIFKCTQNAREKMCGVLPRTTAEETAKL